MTDFDYETFGAKALTWAMIAGAALLFLEITWSPAQLPTVKAATVQTVTVQPDRLARN
jgi:hypothetical protein